MVAEALESSASVQVDPGRVDIHLPDFELPEGGLNIRWPEDRLEIEKRVQNLSLPAALTFARAQGLDRTVIDSPRRRLGIVATGKAYLDVRQALGDLGIDEGVAAEIGLSIYKVGLSWPLDGEGARSFAQGLEEILVVEEKRPNLELQLKDKLYDLAETARPRVVGKLDEAGRPLISAIGELSPGLVAQAIAGRLERFHTSQPIAERLAFLEQKQEALERVPADVIRMPYFCSGCPHNTSTRVPDGSFAMAGIGCHTMAVWMNRSTMTYTHMGGEGANWIGMQPFTDSPHVFQNMGDGTYYHSGLMAIRASVAAESRITYKILFNGAVAMTGGQPVEGQITVPQIAAQVHAEGIKRLVVVSDEPDKYPAGTRFPPGTDIHHRSALDEVQRQLRQIDGVTVLIYDRPAPPKSGAAENAGSSPIRPSGPSSTRPSVRAAAIATPPRTVFRWSPWKPNSGASAASTNQAATRIFPAFWVSARASSRSTAGLCEKPSPGAVPKQGPATSCPSPTCRPSTTLTASWWPASAALASLPSAPFWAWRRTLRARA
jgi:indolepyruvate ferredoxin oxidoreductase